MSTTVDRIEEINDVLMQVAWLSGSTLKTRFPSAYLRELSRLIENPATDSVVVRSCEQMKHHFLLRLYRGEV